MDRLTEAINSQFGRKFAFICMRTMCNKAGWSFGTHLQFKNEPSTSLPTFGKSAIIKNNIFYRKMGKCYHGKMSRCKPLNKSLNLLSFKVRLKPSFGTLNQPDINWFQMQKWKKIFKQTTPRPMIILKHGQLISALAFCHLASLLHLFK